MNKDELILEAKNYLTNCMASISEEYYRSRDPIVKKYKADKDNLKHKMDKDDKIKGYMDKINDLKKKYKEERKEMAGRYRVAIHPIHLKYMQEKQKVEHRYKMRIRTIISVQEFLNGS